MKETPRVSLGKKLLGFLKRVGLLVRLQASQKFKFTTNKIKFLVSTLFKIAIAVAVVFGMRFLIGYFRFRTAGVFALSDDMLAFLIAIYLAISLISSIFSVINQIYKSTDNEYLISLPVKPQEVFISKVILVVIQELINSILILLPMLLGFALSVSKAYLTDTYEIYSIYYVTMALMIMILPLITVGVTLILSLPIYLIMRFIEKHLALKLIVSLAACVLYIYIANILLSSIMDAINFASQLNVICLKIKVFLYNFSTKTYVFAFLAKLFSTNFGQVIYVLLGCIVLFAMAYLMIRSIYFKLVLTSSHSKRMKAGAKIGKKSKPFISILKKDLHMLFSSGGDFTKYFLLSFIAPCVVLIMNKVFGASDLSKMGRGLIIAVNIASTGMFINMNCSYVATALSQEGPNFYLTKTTPVSYKKQIIVKFLINSIINMIIILFCTVIMTILTPITITQGLVAFISLSLVNFAHLCYTLTEELKTPLIDWFDSSELVNHKTTRRANAVGLLLGIVFGAFAFKFYVLAPERAWFELIILASVIAIYNFNYMMKHHNYYLNQINK